MSSLHSQAPWLDANNIISKNELVWNNDTAGLLLCQEAYVREAFTELPPFPSPF